MSQNLQFLRSTTPGQKPTQLNPGQIAFNLVDKRLFVGDGSNNITDVSGNITAGINGEGFFESDLDITTAVASANSYTDAQIAALINGAPAVLDTLNELAAALGDDANFVSTVTSRFTSVEGDLASEITRATAAEATLQSNIDAEATRATAAETANTNAINAEVARAQAAESGIAANLTNEITRAQAAEATLTSDLADEVTRAQAAEATLTSDLADEVTRAQAAEATLTADLGTEVARAQAAEATLTTDLAAEVARATAAETVLQSNIDAEATRAQAAEASLGSDVSTETARAQAAEAALDVRVDAIEYNLSTDRPVVYENNTAAIGTLDAPVQDPDYRDGWYYTNTGTGVNDRVQWTFYDGSTTSVAADDFSAFAVITFDSVSEVPFLEVFTKPTGTNDAVAGDHHSRLRYVIPAGSVSVGETYVVYTGSAPNIHPELPQVQMNYDPANSAATHHVGTDEVKSLKLATQQSPAAIGASEFLLDGVGTFDNANQRTKKTVRFRKATVADLDFDFGTF